jgi:hypothetical protein
MRGAFPPRRNAQQPLAATLAFGDQMPDDAAGAAICAFAVACRQAGCHRLGAARRGRQGRRWSGLESIDVSADQARCSATRLVACRSRPSRRPMLNMDVDAPAMPAISACRPRNWTSVASPRGCNVCTGRKIRHRCGTRMPPTVAPTPAASSSAAAAAPPTPAENPANTGINPCCTAAVSPVDRRSAPGRCEARRGAPGNLADGERHAHRAVARAVQQVQITASGDWNGSATDSHTHMNIDFAADDLGRMLGAFGFDGLVNGGKTSDQLDASWPGSPNALSLANMDGTLSINVNDGRIPEVSSPGAGRFLGLVRWPNCRAVSRWISVTCSARVWRSIRCRRFPSRQRQRDHRQPQDRRPAGTSRITGRTGSAREGFRSAGASGAARGNSLPIVGAVVGGPIGAAAGFAVQGLLGRGLNTDPARYRITGSWDKPVMTLIEKHGVAAPAAVPAPAAPRRISQVRRLPHRRRQRRAAGHGFKVH